MPFEPIGRDPGPPYHTYLINPTDDNPVTAKNTSHAAPEDSSATDTTTDAPCRRESRQTIAIEAVPVELLRVIFGITLHNRPPWEQDLDAYAPQITALQLSHVCTLWRRIVHDFPELWTQSNFGDPSIYRNPAAFAHFLTHARDLRNAWLIQNANGMQFDSVLPLNLYLDRFEQVDIWFKLGKKFVVAEEFVEAALERLVSGSLETDEPEQRGFLTKGLWLSSVPDDLRSLRALSIRLTISNETFSDGRCLWVSRVFTVATQLEVLRIHHGVQLASNHYYTLTFPRSLRVLHLPTIHDGRILSLVAALAGTPLLEEFECPFIQIGNFFPPENSDLGSLKSTYPAQLIPLNNLRRLVLDSSELGVIPPLLLFHHLISAPHASELYLHAPVPTRSHMGHWKPRDDQVPLLHLLDAMACERITKITFDLTQDGLSEDSIIACLEHPKVQPSLVFLEIITGEPESFPWPAEESGPRNYGDGILEYLESGGGRTDSKVLTVPRLERLVLRKCLDEMSIADGRLGSLYYRRREKGFSKFVVEIVEEDMAEFDVQIGKALGERWAKTRIS